MKKLIIPLFTTLAACSASNGDDIAPAPSPDDGGTGVAISFGGSSNAWQDATTRAGDTGLENVYPSFRVWGYKTTDAEKNTSQLVMDGYNVQHYDTEGNKGWEYVGVENSSLGAAQTIKYWDYSATSYRFFGYSPMDADVTKKASSDNIQFSLPFSYSPDYDGTALPYLSELWLSANGHDEPPYGQTVTMAFKPVIAKVRFRFSYPENTKRIKIENITFQDIRYKDDASTALTPVKGTVDITTPLTGSSDRLLTWTPAAENATGHIVLTVPYEEADDAIHILDDASLYGKWYYVPPLAEMTGDGAFRQAAYIINATIDGNHSSATISAEYMQWKAGYQYTYIFKITEAGTDITFYDMEVEEWKTASDIDNNGNGTTGW